MKLLLDTHVFLWYITADPRLPESFRAAIREASNEVYLSAASVWEAVIKHNLGKLPLPGCPADYFELRTESPPCQSTREQCRIWPRLRHSTAIRSIDCWLRRRFNTDLPWRLWMPTLPHTQCRCSHPSDAWRG